MRNQSRTTGANGDAFRRLEVSTGGGHRRRWTAEDNSPLTKSRLADSLQV